MSLFVAGAVLGEGQVSLFLTGAVLGEGQVSLFVAGTVKVKCVSDHGRIILGSFSDPARIGRALEMAF